jgi:predicted histone-like DNA-binding protein
MLGLFYFIQFLQKNHTTTTRQFATEISKRTGLSTSDAMASIEAFLDLITDRTLEGKIVRLGDFGKFSINISSQGVDNADDLNVTHIKGNSLQFRPGKVVTQKLVGAEYKKISE